MSNVTHTYRRLAALTELVSGKKLTQRSLAARLGISLGLANALLRTLAEDGLVRVNPSGGSRRMRYSLTKAGRAEMTKLGIEFAAEAGDLLADLRAELQKQAKLISRRGVRRVLLCGSGPLADMAASAILNARMKLAAVVSVDKDAGSVAGMPARPLAQAGRIPCQIALTLSQRDIVPLRKSLGRRVPVRYIFARLPAEERRHGS